ncbi:unnamed protein product [Meloidogyne enterolobii]|uniref:Uncharacterized protein n=2 Tax=Meloidogyne enterolobii TaxID=390850 RepID=A0A6V7XB79_MELEN|nr:unnamed protein product [Meloidogyne enterolobii]
MILMSFDSARRALSNELCFEKFVGSASFGQQKLDRKFRPAFRYRFGNMRRLIPLPALGQFEPLNNKFFLSK